MSDRVAAFDRRLREHAARVLLAKALALQAQAKRDYSVPNPAPHGNPAPKSQFPRARSFALRDAVAISPASLAEIAATGRVTVGVGRQAFYGAVLARKGWLGLLDTYRRVRPRLERLGKHLGG